MFFRQIKRHGDNFSYIVADEAAKEAAVIDTSFNGQEIIKLLKLDGFSLKYIFNTHGHSDHTAGNIELQRRMGGKVVAHKRSKMHADLLVDEADTLTVGQTTIKIIYTPGHTVDGICLLVDGKKLLTGDTLFVGECGRTDLSGGDAKSMYESLFYKLSTLSDDIEVYPGHDYGDKPSSTIGAEKKSNYTLQPRSLQAFLEFMSEP